MRRREFITLVATTATVWPLAARAQRPTMPVIGFLGGADPAGYRAQMQALRLGLGDHGYIEGRNIAIEYRWAEGNYDRLPAFAAELVSLKSISSLPRGRPQPSQPSRQRPRFPFVMAIVGNPVETGIVASLARPGANITGSSFFYPEINAKRLELIKTAKTLGLTLSPTLLARADEVIE